MLWRSFDEEDLVEGDASGKIFVALLNREA